MIFLDNATITRPCKAALQVMNYYLGEGWSPVQDNSNVFQKGEAVVRELLGIGNQGLIIFCSENQLDDLFNSKVVASVYDDNGCIDLELLEKNINTDLVSLSWACSATGVIQPIEEVAELCQEYGVPLHLEVSHLLGRGYLDLSEIKPAYVSFKGRYLYAPPGLGVLFSAENKGCPYSDDVAGVAALTEALKDVMEHCDFVCMEIARLRDMLEDGIKNKYEEAIVCFQDSDRLPNSSTFIFPGVPTVSLVAMLQKQGVYANDGKGIFQKIFKDKINGQCAINFTLSQNTSEEEIKQTIEIIVKTVSLLRNTTKKII